MKELKELQKWLKNLGIDCTISELKNLKELYLGGNNLTTIPDSIGKLKNLRVLGLSNNNLTVIPDGIGKLENLKTLFLSHNNLTTIPDSIGKLENLERLHLDNNNLVFCNVSLDHITYLYTNNTTLTPHTELTEILYGIYYE